MLYFPTEKAGQCLSPLLLWSWCGLFSVLFVLLVVFLIITLECSAQVNKWLLRDISVVLNSPVILPYLTPGSLFLVVQTFFLRIVVAATRRVQGGGRVWYEISYWYRLEPTPGSYSTGYSFSRVRTVCTGQITHLDCLWGTNVKSVRNWGPLVLPNKPNGIGWERKSEVVFIVKSVTAPSLGLICQLNSGHALFRLQ